MARFVVGSVALLAAVAGLGAIAALRHFHEKRDTWDLSRMDAFALANSLEYLRYARVDGAPWRPMAYVAASAGSLDCAQDVHEICA